MLTKSNYKRVKVNGEIKRVWIGEGPEPNKEEKVDYNKVTKENIDTYFEDLNKDLMSRIREVNKNGLDKIDRDLRNVNRKHFSK